MRIIRGECFEVCVDKKFVAVFWSYKRGAARILEHLETVTDDTINQHNITAVCPNVTGRTKERIAQSKRVRAGSLALVD